MALKQSELKPYKPITSPLSGVINEIVVMILQVILLFSLIFTTYAIRWEGFIYWLKGRFEARRD